MPINPTSKVTVSSFQQCDGTNFTTAGVDNSFKTGRGNIGVYTGIGLTFDGKPASAVIDLKVQFHTVIVHYQGDFVYETI